jgi:Phage tail protein RIFT-related domain
VPILAVPVVGAEADVVDTPRTIAFRALDGTYPFPVSDTDFIFGPDSTGLDKPPQEVITQPVPGLEGERLREIRIGKREVFLPLWLFGVSHQEYLDRRDTLANLFNHRLVDYVTEDGTLDLEANSIRGTRRLRCVYVDGMTAVLAPNERATWAKLGITLWACRPYWYGVPWSTPIIQKQGTEPDFFAEFPGDLSGALVLGDNIPVVVGGDVESWMTVEVRGPASSVAVSGEGLLVSIPDGLAAGETAQIVTDPRGRTALFDGVKNWSRIGPTTTWQPLQPGTRHVSIAAAGGVTAATQAVIYGPTRYERPW